MCNKISYDQVLRQKIYVYVFILYNIVKRRTYIHGYIEGWNW